MVIYLCALIEHSPQREDDDYWKAVKLLREYELDDLKKKHDIPEPMIKGLLSKKRAIENWEVVRIGEDLSII